MPFNWSKLIKPIIACECLSYKKKPKYSLRGYIKPKKLLKKGIKEKGV